jgi:hypothetical protein
MFRRNLSVAESNMADVLYAMNRTDEALAKQRQVLVTGLALSAADPTNVTTRNDVVISGRRSERCWTPPAEAARRSRSSRRPWRST